jgi:hypothetical protein
MILKSARLSALLAVVFLSGHPAVQACCPAPRPGQPAVNADQTVILIWDPKTQTEHFIRRASFKSAGDDFGFLVPTPSQPQLEESGDAAFPVLAQFTAPMVKPRSGGSGCGFGCSKSASMSGSSVAVLEEKTVAGFHAVVLETRSSQALVEWLRDHGYSYSPEIQAWAEPYVTQGWKITAMKVAKSEAGSATAPAAGQSVAAAALRISFKTDRPLFPYREPDPTVAAQRLGAKQRLLRIYFVSDGRYQGGLMPENPWTGKAVWSGDVGTSLRDQLLSTLKLPKETTPDTWWLTEFEDNWPYRAAPADLYFSRSADQSPLARPMQYASAAPARLFDAAPYVLVVVMVGLSPYFRRLVGRRK